MIKKIIISSIIIICLLSPVSTFAMELSLPQLGGLADLGYGLSIGANFDFTDSKYVVQNWDNLTNDQRASAVRAAAWDFMEDYSISRGIPYSTSSGALPLDQASFFKSVYFDSNIKKVFSNYLTAEDAGLNSDATLRMPISRQAVSDWALYRDNAWERYKNSFSIPDNPDVPVEIPIEFSYIVNINTLYTSGYGSKFNFLDYTGVCFDVWGGTISINGNLRDYSYVSSNFISASRTDPTNLNYDCRIQSTGISPLIRIDITSGFPTTVTYSTYTNLLNNNIFTWVTNPNNGTYGSFNFYINSSRTSRPTVSDANYSAFNYNQSSFNSLSDALQYIYQHYANIDLYVDGDAWIISGANAPANPVIPDFPDVINPDGDLPVDLVDLPSTDGNVGTFDITSLFDALMEAIVGASDTDNTTSGILTGEGVSDTYRDTTGELVADESIPLADIVDDSFPIQDTKNYPNLPLIDEPIHNAFAGTTILSQLIHACDTVLPSELMLVFWGIIFTLFIIGLIKILHK